MPAEDDLAPASVLAPFLADRGVIEPGSELEVSEIGNGHSNLTFLLRETSGTASVVLRRPPRPPYAESAHDVLREARLLENLHGRGVPLPRILATCEDIGPLGVPFAIMEFIEGVSIDEQLPAGIDAAGCASIGDELVHTLAALHAIDPGVAGLGDPTRADSYLARQIKRFSSIWEAQRTRDLADMDHVTAWLADHIPTSPRRAVVHGDFRLGNSLFSVAGVPKLTGLLDWEMAALGDPLADLGYMLASWAEPDDPDNPILRLSFATRSPGFPTREQLRLAYERVSGIPTDGIAFYEVLGTWKSAIFLEASYRRFIEGRASDSYFETLGEGIPQIAATARARIPD
jgi:aminoglycoside phosphotransferase (APT) family kinase protein